MNKMQLAPRRCAALLGLLLHMSWLAAWGIHPLMHAHHAGAPALGMGSAGTMISDAEAPEAPCPLCHAEAQAALGTGAAVLEQVLRLPERGCLSVRSALVKAGPCRLSALRGPPAA